MDPFTQRMLERARARQEKIDQKLASSGQKVPKRKPLTENAVVNADTPVKSPGRPNRESRGSRDSKPTRDSLQSPKKEILSPKKVTRSPKILTQSPKLATQDSSTDKAPENMETKMERNGLRHNVKSRLDRLGVLYSDKADLSSPIHRTELEFSSETPPSADTPRPPRPLPDGKRKFGRLAALADTINNWEDDLTHHTAQPEPAKKTTKTLAKALKDESTLDVSIHSLNDINNVLQAASRAKESPKPIDTGTFTKPSGNETFLNKNVVAELEILRQLVAQSANIIENRSTKTSHNINKRKEWKTISTRFNELTGKRRSDEELKLAWKRQKLSAKSNLSFHRREQEKTGGGEKPPSPSQEDLAIMEIAPHDFVIEVNDYDSDAVIPSSLQLAPTLTTTTTFTDPNPGPSSIENIVLVNEDNVGHDVIEEKETIHAVLTTNEKRDRTNSTVTKRKSLQNRTEDMRKSIVESNKEFKERQLEIMEIEHKFTIEIAKLKMKKLKLEIALLESKKNSNTGE